jgi:hypothetical protein
VKTISREDLKEKIDRGDEFVRRHSVPWYRCDTGSPTRQIHPGDRLLLELQLTLLDAGRP